MNSPLIRDSFFHVLASYNDAVWPMPLAALGAAIAVAALTTTHAAWRGRAAAALLAALWAWMGGVFHASYLSTIDPAAPWFGAACMLGSATFAWYGVRHDALRFDDTVNFARGPRRIANIVGWALVIVALFVYPMIGVAMGQHFPASASFGTPGPTTIYTIGLLVLASPMLPRVLWVAPLLWVVPGTLSAFALGLPQDLLLPVAAAMGLWVTGRAASVPPHSASAKL